MYTKQHTAKQPKFSCFFYINDCSLSVFIGTYSKRAAYTETRFALLWENVLSFVNIESVSQSMLNEVDHHSDNSSFCQEIQLDFFLLLSVFFAQSKMTAVDWRSSGNSTKSSETKFLFVFFLSLLFCYYFFSSAFELISTDGFFLHFLFIANKNGRSLLAFWVIIKR